MRTDAMSQKSLGMLEVVGESIVVVAAALWVTHDEMVAYVFAAGTVLFAIGRLAQGWDAVLSETPQQARLNMRRLLRQRNIGMILLMAAAALMFVRHRFCLAQGVYIFPSSWIVPFTCFVVIEVYTAFRMPYLMK